MDAISSARSGLMAAVTRFDAVASRTASGAGDPVQDAVDRIGAKTAFAANVSVLKTADAMSKALLDIKV